MEWDNDKCLQLIEMYEMKPETWQSTHKHYFNKIKKQDAWHEIAKGMEISNTEVVKCKMNSLLSSFRRERTKEATTRGTYKPLLSSILMSFNRFKELRVVKK